VTMKELTMILVFSNFLNEADEQSGIASKSSFLYWFIISSGLSI